MTYFLNDTCMFKYQIPKYTVPSLLFFVINLLYTYVCDVGVRVQTCYGVHMEAEGYLLGTLISPTLYQRQNSSRCFCPWGTYKSFQPTLTLFQECWDHRIELQPVFMRVQESNSGCQVHNKGFTLWTISSAPKVVLERTCVLFMNKRNPLSWRETVLTQCISYIGTCLSIILLIL